MNMNKTSKFVAKIGAAALFLGTSGCMIQQTAEPNGGNVTTITPLVAPAVVEQTPVIVVGRPYWGPILRVDPHWGRRDYCPPYAHLIRRR